MEELNQLLGKTKPVSHDCLIAVTQSGVGILIESNPCLYGSDLFDGCFLEDNLTDKKNIPTEPGIYKCKIFVHGYRCNHPEDPEEWDMAIWLDDVIKQKYVNYGRERKNA